MAIIDQSAIAEETLLFDNVFLKSLLIEQNMISVKSELGMFNVKIVYSKFAVKSNDKIVFGKESTTIYIKNYTKKALEKAAAGDSDMINALGAIQKAVAEIIADSSGMSLIVK